MINTPYQLLFLCTGISLICAQSFANIDKLSLHEKLRDIGTA